MLNLIIAEAALETVPKPLWTSPSVIRQARYRGKKPGDLILDRSYHHEAMLKMKDHQKRGRPDIIHLALLEVTSTPLFFENRLKVWVHTFNNKVICIGDYVRLPKSYFRFEGLIEQLFRDHIVISNGQHLLEIFEMDLKDLLQIIKPSQTIGLSRFGSPSSFQDIAGELAKTERPVVVVGGFPRGHFSKVTNSCFTNIASVSSHPLEANVVLARVIYEYEKLMAK